MSTIIERDWITHAGLRAICLVVLHDSGRKSHRCGYVEVPIGHPLHGVEHGEQVPNITQADVNKVQLGKRGPMLLLASVCRSDGDGVIRRSPDILFDVHGGLTFSESGKFGYPVQSDGWWFGFDCNHYADGHVDFDEKYSRYGIVRTQEYVEAECDRLSAQIVAKFPVVAAEPPERPTKETKP